LLSLTDAERQWYLRGYFLALGQELSILEAQLSSPKPQGDALQSLLEGVRARRQLLSKAARDNLGFEKSLLSFCRAPDNGWVGMFEAIWGPCTT
jgi:hypothetical protein